MFEEIIRRVQSLNQHVLSVPIEADEKGYIDKQCPSKLCEFLFKVNEGDWRNIVRNECVWCPFCGYQAPADQWFTMEQVEHSKSEALAYLEGQIDSALRSGAQSFNRTQARNSFISMSVTVTGPRKRTYIVPAEAADVMQLEVKCDRCATRFAIVGSAYFCPSCGHNSVTRAYHDSLRKLRAKIDSLEIVRRALINAGKKDEAELTCRSLLESSIQDGVTAFQKLCEGLYKPYEATKKPAFNTFQRLQQGSEIWTVAIGVGYSEWLNKDEIAELTILFQKRHLLSHTDGIVDQEYLERSGDQAYKLGQRIVITSKDVHILLNLLGRLGIGLMGRVNDSPELL